MVMVVTEGGKEEDGVRGRSRDGVRLIQGQGDGRRW